jgi:GT2 family glycosyltransferase
MTSTPTPRLSVVVPTYGRPERILQLLCFCDAQTLAPEDFELVVVDDGSPEPIAIDARRHRFALTLLRQANAGPGAARNAAIEHCRAPLVLILNDDAVPAPELFERHLAVHAERAASGLEPVAVLGTFTFTAEALQHPFVQVLADSDLLFDFPGLKHGELHPWTFFWTCNLSLPRAAIERAGGFDALRFREAIVEDVELGYRLERMGWQVLHRADLHCEHDHVIDCEAYMRRMVRLGVNLARMHAKHGDARILWRPDGAAIDEHYLHSVQSVVEAFTPALAKFRERMGVLEASHPPGERLQPQLLAQLRTLTRRLGLVCFYRGLLLENSGHDPEPVVVAGPAEGRVTSVIAVSHQNLDSTRRCLAALRASHDERHPLEILFVDNGSTDGTAEFLAEQPDVELISNAENLGAPRARNQALMRARGDYVVFLDSDAMVTPGWLARLLYHAEVDGSCGCVGPVSDRAAHGQQVPLPVEPEPELLAAFADDLARDKRRQHRFGAMLSSFCLLVRREVLAAIGGFDERFSPWGFEDDDFTLRATLAGFRNRIALDVFVQHEAYSGPKLANHSALLEQNWRRFCEKWELDPSAGAHGSDLRVASVLERAWPREQLYFDPAGELVSSPHAA